MGRRRDWSRRQFVGRATQYAWAERRGLVPQGGPARSAQCPLGADDESSRAGRAACIRALHPLEGGAFEDQQYLQLLQSERFDQVLRAMAPFRIRGKREDLGVLVREFNATTTYDRKGNMHAYFTIFILPPR